MVVQFDDAVRLVLEQAAKVRDLPTEVVQLLASRGRVLAAGLPADRDQPPFSRATRDGFAVRAEEASSGRELRVVGTIHAGEVWRGGPIEAGTAVAIMTGAPMPAGADAVAMVEHVERLGETVRIAARRSLQVGENVVARGSEARAGALLLAAGTMMGAAEIALTAACGAADVEVYRGPRVAIVATGDELVELGEPPETHQIRNSNSYGLAALVEAAGGEAMRRPIARDRTEAILDQIEAARRCDLLVLSGGVSMGEHDLVEGVLEQLGAEFFFTGVKMQPGRPVVFGRLPERGGDPALYFYGLPGNPVSTQVTFAVFVAPMIRAMAGAGAEGARFVLGRLGEAVPPRTGLTRLLPGRMNGTEVKLVGWQGSGDLAANARANCYVLLEDSVEYRRGDVARVLLR